MDLAHGHTEAVCLACEVATDLVGVQVGLGEEVPRTDQRQVPPVAGGAEELLEHRQVVLSRLDPAVQVGDVGVAVLRQRAVDLDVGVTTRRDFAEHLHQAVVAERDGGVALLAAKQGRVRPGVEVVAGDPVEGDAAVLVRRLRRRLGERVEVDRHRLAVVHSVVAVHLAEVLVEVWPEVRVPDAALLGVVVRQRHLVALGGGLGAALVGVLDGDDVDGHRGRTGEGADALDVDHVVLTALAGEPARLGQVGRHRGVVGHLAAASGSGAGAGSRIQ